MRIIVGIDGVVVVAVTPRWRAKIAVATPVVPAATITVEVVTIEVVAVPGIIPAIPAATEPRVIPAVPTVAPATAPTAVEGTPTVPSVKAPPAVPTVPGAVAVVDQHGYTGVDERIVIIKVGVDGVKITEAVVRPVKATDTRGIVVIIILVVFVFVVIGVPVACRVVVIALFVVIVTRSDCIVGGPGSVNASVTCIVGGPGSVNASIVSTRIPVWIVVQVIVLTQCNVAQA